MPSNVTLVNATGSFAGIPYLTVSAAAGLAPGQSVTVGTQFEESFERHDQLCAGDLLRSMS